LGEVFYTRTYASYEQGDVENCTRILRRWLPKRKDFSCVSVRRLRQVERSINAMHRASLGGATAEQRDRELCDADSGAPLYLQGAIKNGPASAGPSGCLRWN